MIEAKQSPTERGRPHTRWRAAGLAAVFAVAGLAVWVFTQGRQKGTLLVGGDGVDRPHTLAAGAPSAMAQPTSPMEEPQGREAGTRHVDTISPEALGDVTGDGRIDRRDFTLLMRLAARQGQADSDLLLRADLNRDGRIDAEDARLLMRTIEKQELAVNP